MTPGPSPTGRAASSSTVLLVLSGLFAVLLSWTLYGLLYAAPAVLALVARRRRSTSERAARVLVVVGWVLFSSLTAVFVVAVVVGLVRWWSYGTEAVPL